MDGPFHVGQVVRIRGRIRVNSRHQLTITATSGAYTLTVTLDRGEETTRQIRWDATSDQIERALIALPSVNEHDVIVTGPQNGPFVIEWVQRLGARGVPIIAVTSVSLPGGTGVLATVIALGGPADADVGQPTLAVRRPDGSTAATTAITKDALGEYRADVTPNMTGFWTYEWSATGSVVAQDGDTFQVIDHIP